ncbi:MAG: hypothetical protein V4721_13950 [Bacteroidota bacterium]
MKPESTFEKIIRKTGKKPVDCKCVQCKSQCNHPCLGTPEDMFKIMAAGFGKRVMQVKWAGGIAQGFTDKEVPMITPLYDKEKKTCTFFTNGLCELHESGLKPTEGKLSHHSTDARNLNKYNSIGWAVAKEWLALSQEKANELVDKYIKKIEE